MQPHAAIEPLLNFHDLWADEAITMKIFPEGFIEHLKTCAGFDQAAFIRAHDEAPPVSIRVNPRKPIHAFDHAEKIPWCTSGYYLKTRPQFTLDPLLHAGTYYVQEASSMFLEFVLKQCCDLTQPLRILDLCAAPGGKSTLIASLLTDDGLLVSNEVIRSRTGVLKENLTKWGNDNVMITQNDPADFSKLVNCFDVIVIDAPCSGSGLFRKDAQAMKTWSEENVAMCGRRQKRIVADITPCLKENGILIYATCSYSQEEDEDVVKAIMETGKFEMCPLDVDASWGIVRSDFGYRFYPDKLNGEGFFINVLQKISGDHDEPDLQPKAFEFISPEAERTISSWVDMADHVFVQIKNRIVAVRKNHLHDLELFSSCLHIISAGIEVGEIKGDDLIPAHDLAMSRLVNKNIRSVEVDEKTALAYLRKNPVEINTMSPGWVLIKYQEHALGWVKILPNRVNNYYPVEWRIRK